MIRKRGKMGLPVKNGTRYKKCTLANFVAKYSTVLFRSFVVFACQKCRISVHEPKLESNLWG